MFYSIIRSLLFCLPPETAHRVALKSLKWLTSLSDRARQVNATTPQPLTISGLSFPNRAGLAAGLDKNGEYIDALASLGFGFIEIGTVTPRPQPGNPKPRLFRLPKAQAIINRMGFNNQGIDQLLINIKKAHFKGILGINIGKNFDTPLELALQDYSLGLTRVYPYASYVVINISSPNTPGLRQLQHGAALAELLSALKKLQADLAVQYQKYVPLWVKISPDLTQEELKQMARIFIEEGIEGVIATNTTISRAGVEHIPQANTAGGMSGKPLFQKSLAIVRQLHEALEGKIPIIACGGIMSTADAQTMLEAGASLIQLYTGFIYQGPSLITECGSGI